MNALDVVASVLGALAGLAGGMWFGLYLGRRYRVVRWKLRAVYACALVACLGISAGGTALGARWLTIGALGLLAGLLTGVKYGARGGFLPTGPEAPQAESQRVEPQRTELEGTES